VGKTSTAECVADYTKRPLYPITCGDIGDNATTVESNLEKNFSLARQWNCVLLLDEAE
jgi:AAA+ superfamily predicted ATPase